MDPVSEPFYSPKKVPCLVCHTWRTFILHVALLVLSLGDHQFQAFDLLVKPKCHQETL